jgi:UDP-2,3-diacylglucosamine pyrophosphatase LpxH
MTARTRLAIVSDLHMATPDAPGGDPFADDRAFAELLVALATRRIRTRLLLLGDTFDLVLAGRGGLDAVAAAHRAVFDALAGFAAAGHEIEVVPGNRDVDLLRPPARERLRSLLAAPVLFHPWVVHVPGVLYAEHGRQPHAIDHLRHALDLGLPADVLVEVDRRSAPIALWMARRGDFMRATARGVADVLAGAGAATAFCVFGHTHVAADEPLRLRPGGPRYLNAGTWSSLLRRGRDGALDRRRWVEIEHGGGVPPTAALRHWEPTR